MKDIYGQSSFHHRLDWLFEALPFTVEHLLRANLGRNDTVLDIGCGPNSSLRRHKVAHSVGVDIFSDYIRAAKEAKTYDEFILANCMDLEFSLGSFDIVMALDSLEHLTKEDSYKLIAKMKTWARKKIIIAVPNGNTPGLVQDNNPYRKHQSGYSSKELRKPGLRVYRRGVKIPGYTSNGLAFYLIRYGSYPARLITYCLPSLGSRFIRNIRSGETDDSPD